MRRETQCRICTDTPTVGYFGLCRECAAAVNRFIAQRKANFAARKVSS